MLNLYKLDIFLQVVDAGSLSAAAERLLMTQSGVSQHIQDLERALGVQLLTRSPRGVTLTEAGQTLARYARQLAALAAEAEAAVTDVANMAAGEVALGATPGVSVYVLAECVQSFRGRFPNLAVNVQTDITPRIVEMILARKLDIGVVEGELVPQKHLAHHDLEVVDHFVVVGRKHPLWGRSGVKLAELDGLTLITRQRGSQTRIWLEEILAQHQVEPRIGAEFDNVESIKRAVMAGTALTILPRYAVADDVDLGLLAALPVEDHRLQRTIKLLWDARRPFTPVTRAFLRHFTLRFPALTGVI